MDIKFFNTLTHKKEKFTPIHENEVGIYTCGPTVYNYAHIGNLRAYVFSDVLKRALEFNGYNVKQIINITDVGHLTSDEDEGEDKLEAGAKREGKSVWDIAKFYEEAFYSDLKKLNIEPASEYPKATDHIAEMIGIIKLLEEKGLTYEAGGNIYFDTTKFPDYGKMAQLNLDPEALQSRVEADSNKKNPFDFVLWFTNYKYTSHEMLWESPWGKGFPGWHIECSAMATKYLGEHFDIHTGGIDHIPVHHTNEIAQSEGAFGHKWVNYWLHNDFLIEKDGDKMAKSKGDFLRLESIVNKGFSPLDYRYYLLTGHYRSKLQFSWEALDGAKNSLKRAKGKVANLKKQVVSNQLSVVNKSQRKYLDEFKATINDDLNTSVALSVMWKTLDANDLNDAEKIELMKKYDKVLGLNLLENEIVDIPVEIAKLAEKRLKARKEKNWAESDKIRDEILEKGYTIKDISDGFELEKNSDSPKISKEISKAYNHEEFEDKIYKNWEESGYFKPEYKLEYRKQNTDNRIQNTELSGGKFSYDRKIDGQPFVIMMPPPNVTGKLHIGHSLVLTIEDIMTRFHRLKGEPTLWLPGMDHAGIATQTVVDKSLRKKGINKNEIGREKFIEKVWEWKKEYGETILNQTRKMGASCDWSRERFTLDEGLSVAVRKAFVELYEKGLIYRDKYIVNWCPKCHTAIADDEVEHEEQEAKLYYFKYDKDFPITIATTRPETKFGDTGVAVNPEDKRYKEFIGKEFEIKLDGVSRKIKVFGDRAVDPKFGTGAVGVTPAHSSIDWKMAEANNLPVIQVIDEYGKMTEEAGEKYKGLKAKEAGQLLVSHLKENNLLEKEEDYSNNLSICYRCKSAIEPQPSLQWFVKMRPLADKAIKAVKSGEIEIIPKRFEKSYFHWMENIPDWCVSRQLWWGHRLPVWTREVISKPEFLISNENPIFKTSNGTTIQKWGGKFIETYVNTEPPKDPPPGEGNWEQDPDVLDTWFSSALWPFSTLGWPDKTKDFEYFYPTTVLETAYDILPFWVNRMIMMGLELTEKIPFSKVYLHGMVRDENNRKMSKSLGNALDPLDLIPKYGTDALRMALVVGSTPGQDMAIGEPKIKGYRNFSNKIWNASRFVILRVTNGDLQSGQIGEEKIENLDIDKNILTKSDQEILRLHTNVIKSVTNKLDNYKFSQAGEEIYEYFWHQFCDIYIEEAKGQLTKNLRSKDQISNQVISPKLSIESTDQEVVENTKKILIKVLIESLIMLHPFIPFVTEAVWIELKKVYTGLDKSIMISKWPK